jgi:hypothetical protein
MISNKYFVATKDDVRYISDFIIASDQHARVYCFLVDPTLNEPVLEDGTTLPSRWSYPDNLWIRPTPLPIPNEDLVGLNHYDIIDNGISFYQPVRPGVNIVIEVATTPEEFGLTVMLPFQEYLEALIKSGCAFSNNAESWADEDYNKPVQLYWNCTEHMDRVPLAFSAKHYATLTEQDRYLTQKWAVANECEIVDTNFYPDDYSAKHHAIYAHKFAMSDTEIFDCAGNSLGYSSMFFAFIAGTIATGTEFGGIWDATTDTCPTEGIMGRPLERGMWWLVDSSADEGHQGCNNTWYTGDRIFFLGDPAAPTDSDYVRIPNFVFWDMIAGKPTVFPPEAHTHAYATETVRGDLRVRLTGTTLDIWNTD